MINKLSLPKTVIVVNMQGEKMQPTDVGKARRLLKTQKAVIVNKQPFTIRLNQ